MTRKRILFLGTHGQHNIGDELLLETFLAQLGAQHRYVVNTYDLDATRAQLEGRYDIELISTTGSRLPLIRELHRSDAVVFGGGSILKELYASTGRNRYATLCMILGIVTFARRIARIPVGMFNIGVGPVSTPVGRILVRMILAQVDSVLVRDPGSRAVCLEAGVDPGQVRVGVDAVFSAAPEWLLDSGEPVTSGGPTLKLGLNLNHDIENPENWELFLERLAEAVQQLAGTRAVEVHTIPMQSAFKENDDATVLRSFAQRLEGIAVVHHSPRDHRDVARILSGCDVLLSERLHAIVIASIIGVPVYVLAYDVKVRELSSLLGLEEFTVDINRPFGSDDLVSSLDSLIADLDGAGERLGERVQQLASIARGGFEDARQWIEHRHSA